MFKKLMKNKKAQNTAEYAILISLVVAGIIAMQTYAQRALQARVRDASKVLTKVKLGTTTGLDQYEPYYLTTNYEVTRNEIETQTLFDTTKVLTTVDTTRKRKVDGFQESSYNVLDTTNF